MSMQYLRAYQIERWQLKNTQKEQETRGVVYAIACDFVNIISSATFHINWGDMLKRFSMRNVKNAHRLIFYTPILKNHGICVKHTNCKKIIIKSAKIN